MLISPNNAEAARTGTFKKLISGTAVLAAATLLVKIIGLVYKVPLVKYVGVEGMAYFLAANHIYVLLFVISTSGLPVAVSVMISDAVAQGNHGAVRGIYRTALGLFFVIGTVGTCAMLFGSQGIAEFVGIEKSARCIAAIAPAVLMACVAGAIRGFFQGHQIMYHTAISQVIEAIGKLVLGLAGAVYALKSGRPDHIVAAYAILGITVGVAFAMAYLMIAKVLFERKNYSTVGEIKPVHKNESVTLELLRLALPVTLSSTILSLSGIIDTVLIPNCLSGGGYAPDEINRLYSCYGNMAVPVFSLIPSLIAPVATSLVPLVSAAHSTRDSEKEVSSVCQSIKLTLLVSMPASLGIAFFARPIINLIFPSDPDAVYTASSLLSLLSLSILPACFITVTNAILQAKKMASRTILSMLCGVVVKLSSEFVLLNLPGVRMYGAPISTFACNMTVIGINIYYIFRYSRVSRELLISALKIIASSCISIGAVAAIYKFSRINERGSVALLFVIAMAVLLYFILLLILGAFNDILPEAKKLLKRDKTNEQRTKNSLFT